jgi:hypothetical protein
VNRDEGRERADAISTTIGYVINLAVISLMITLAVLLTQAAVDDVNNRASEREAAAVAEHVASEIEAVDSVVSSGSRYGDTTVEKELSLPDSSAGYSSKRGVVSAGFENETRVDTVGVRLADSTTAVVSYDPSTGRISVE